MASVSWVLKLGPDMNYYYKFINGLSYGLCQAIADEKNTTENNPDISYVAHEEDEYIFWMDD